MTRVIDAFPAGPLTDDALKAFENSDRIDGIVPVSRMPGEDLIYAVMLVTESRVYGVAFNQADDYWCVVEDEDRAKDEEATEAVNQAIAEWMNERYEDKYLFPGG